ncbi:MAG: XrtN system VIT domain-containing protein, partial [Hymenobacteraceae bacterium]|nr:XrtN system VIT domain-containing protein [Hymenobacteraceae bacterium]MDX5397347.1 XrtN system VIT domain-containing protein [Hymenobacteraceae bacterium]MDX5513426.1 XrtN system VIT domain-containing protein [Hymenobacteraceae bacterium]
FLLFLVLALISCFSLNKEIPIFQNSAVWLQVYLCIISASFIAFYFREALPKYLLHLVLLVMGSASVGMLYFSLYLLPLYPIGLIGIIALGISLHVFVPAAILITLVQAFRKVYKTEATALYSFLAGVIASALVVIWFVVQWHLNLSHMNLHVHDQVIGNRNELPRWVLLSQELPDGPIFEKLIKSELVYQTPAKNRNFFSLPSRNFEELKQHDPLVMIAAFLFGHPELDQNERIKILESKYDARHHAEERLWSGTALSTPDIITQVKLYPEYRIGYTEKMKSVKNSQLSRWSQQEAIYTFHLPEGSVVTSLSLWINDVEEKGILTTKSKAETAYKTIVGVEARDPSVIHWQEGNRVSVRVFPCTPEEKRWFKIGVTSPLRLEGDQLVYESIYFDGPSSADATESAVVYVDGNTDGAILPPGFDRVEEGMFRKTSGYAAGWNVKIKAPALAASAFTFNNVSYQVRPQKQQYTHFKAKEIYLDVNRSWTENELEDVLKLAKNTEVYVFKDKMIRLTSENQEDLLKTLQKRNFSMLPLHKIKTPEQSLIISKSTLASPNLSDIKKSFFANNLQNHLKNTPQPYRLFNIGTELSPYLKTLKELQVLNYKQGSVNDLKALLQQQKFIKANSHPDVVKLAESGMEIVKLPAQAKATSDAPDHLLRLFAYNYLLRKIGPQYFNQNYVEDELIAVAAEANIVSPLSSLIVLETQQDYERFNIEASKNSLGNASLKSSGSVPEPEEWLLIILAVGTVLYFVLKPRLKWS